MYYEKMDQGRKDMEAAYKEGYSDGYAGLNPAGSHKMYDDYMRGYTAGSLQAAEDKQDGTFKA